MAIQREHSYGRLEFHVEDISSWDGFDEICRFFIEHLGAELLSKNDGPDARVWKMRVNGETVNVVHDDMIGNFFFADRKGGEPIVGELAQRLDERIKATG